jgi:hypothetical protein
VRDESRKVRSVETDRVEIGGRAAWDLMLENEQPYPDDRAVFVRIRARDAVARAREALVRATS